jgi:hypothetical protein
VTAGAIKLRGIVEADETFVLSSRKGERNLDRKARRRGGKASKRGVSHEQVPVLVAADRSGATVSAILPAVSAAHLQAVLQPVLDQDALLVTDGCTSYPPCAAAMGISHEALNQTAGERVRGELHIQTVNSGSSPSFVAIVASPQSISTAISDGFILQCFQGSQHHAQSSPQQQVSCRLDHVHS